MTAHHSSFRITACMSTMRSLAVGALIALAANGCGGSDDDKNAAGAGGTVAGAAGTSAGTSAGSGTAGTNAGSSAGVAGTSAGNGTAGTSAGGTAGTGAGSGAAGTSGGGAGTGGDGKTVCKAPVPSTKPGNTCKNTAPPALKLTPIVSGLASPVFVTQAPGDKTRLFVVELRGKIKVIKDGAVESTPFLDITSKVATAGEAGLAGEQGLLGMAFDPNYQTTGRFWVKYSKTATAQGDDTVAQLTATPGGVADATSEKVLTEISAPHPQALRNHNGGMLAFGPDGCLYISYGDGGGGGDPSANGQKTSDIFASLLRIDVENYPAAAPGNMTGAGVNPHLWSYGLRNAWRFSFDKESGDIYIGDVGQDAWEEVDVEPAGTGHRNYGWNVMEAKHCYPNGNACDKTGKTLPAIEYANPPGGQSSVIGGYVYRGKIAGMIGRYIYGDAFSRTLKTFTYSGETAGAPEVCDEADLDLKAPANLYSFGEDLDGEIYVVSAGGTIERIDAE